ncbi:hypothetical protein OAS39_09965 [Pirellulales bacterium]|nr:hypothetical protein [Pirellulales bacterium]
MQYYVGDDAQRSAAELWAMESGEQNGLGEHLGDQAGIEAIEEDRKTTCS